MATFLLRNILFRLTLSISLLQYICSIFHVDIITGVDFDTLEDLVLLPFLTGMEEHNTNHEHDLNQVICHDPPPTKLQV